MPVWHLTILTPASRLELLRRAFARQGALPAAAGALAATLLLGWAAPAPLPALPLTLVGMAGVAGLGLLAWLIAKLTVLPLADPRTAALAAALIPPTLFPGMGGQAFIVPMILALWMGWRRNDQRVVALMVQCGAIAAIAGAAAMGLAVSFVIATILGFAWFFAVRTLSGAANDNPQMERVERFGGDSSLPHPSCYAKGESSPGKWGVS